MHIPYAQELMDDDVTPAFLSLPWYRFRFLVYLHLDLQAIKRTSSGIAFAHSRGKKETEKAKIL